VSGLFDAEQAIVTLLQTAGTAVSAKNSQIPSRILSIGKGLIVE